MRELRPVLLGFVILLGGAGCLGSPCGPSEGVVDHVVDGDTLELTDGTRYRLLLLDTPETTGGKDDCYGQEAKAEFARLVEGKTVQLKYVDAECTDKYDRLLAWVSVDGLDVNAHLVEQGFACLYDYGTAGDARLAEFEELEFAARNGRKGVWGECNPVTCQH